MGKKDHYKYIIGIDEAGRGPIAGPVAVGLVMILKKDRNLLRGVKDSKKLTPKQREKWFKKIKKLEKEGKLFSSCSLVSEGVIDKKGIVYAINLGIKRGCSKAGNKNSEVLLDGGLRAPKEYKNQKTIIKGDQKILVISAASIVAKVTRDRKMFVLAKKYPKYGFESHKGYGTEEHYRNLKKRGLSKIHRKTFIH